VNCIFINFLIFNTFSSFDEIKYDELGTLKAFAGRTSLQTAGHMIDKTLVLSNSQFSSKFKKILKIGKLIKIKFETSIFTEK